jgi:hypothetical protein
MTAKILDSFLLASMAKRDKSSHDVQAWIASTFDRNDRF